MLGLDRGKDGQEDKCLCSTGRAGKKEKRGEEEKRYKIDK